MTYSDHLKGKCRKHRCKYCRQKFPEIEINPEVAEYWLEDWEFDIYMRVEKRIEEGKDIIAQEATKYCELSSKIHSLIAGFPCQDFKCKCCQWHAAQKAFRDNK